VEGLSLVPEVLSLKVLVEDSVTGCGEVSGKECSGDILVQRSGGRFWESSGKFGKTSVRLMWHWMHHAYFGVDWDYEAPVWVPMLVPGWFWVFLEVRVSWFRRFRCGASGGSNVVSGEGSGVGSGLGSGVSSGMVGLKVSCNFLKVGSGPFRGSDCQAATLDDPTESVAKSPWMLIARKSIS